MTSSLAKKLAGEPISKVEITIRCNNLLDKDILSKSDPCCVVHIMNGGQWYEVKNTFNFIPPPLKLSLS